MTEEQIKQNAEEYYDKLDSITIEVEDEPNSIVEAYVAGAHSRDEEIKELLELRRNNRTMSHLLDVQDRKINDLEDELSKLRDSWISVEERLPEEIRKGIELDRSEMVLLIVEDSLRYTALGFYDYAEKKWFVYHHGYANNVTHWMPIPELKKEKLLLKK